MSSDKNLARLVSTSLAHVYWLDTGLSFILFGSVLYPPEYTITTLLLPEWISVRLTTGLVPISWLIQFQPVAKVSSIWRDKKQKAFIRFLCSQAPPVLLNILVGCFSLTELSSDVTSLMWYSV